MQVTSSRLERVHRHVMDLQDQYHSAQKKVIQLSREFQLRTDKPEYQQRCREIWKDLCDKIDEVVWKQKDYERENRKLEKMIHQRTFTRIERAYAADLISGNTADISTSNDQGLSTSSTAPVKLTTKEKIRQLQMMLHELEDEVHSQNEEASNLQWENSDESDEEKKESSTITSAQAKLAKELIKLANTYKVPELTFTDKARTRRSAYQTWFNELRPILAMFKETSTLIQGEKITPF